MGHGDAVCDAVGDEGLGVNDFWPRLIHNGIELHGAASTHSEAHYNQKLTAREVKEIRHLYHNFGMRRSRQLSQRSLAARYGVHQTVIGYVVRRQTWKHIA